MPAKRASTLPPVMSPIEDDTTPASRTKRVKVTTCKTPSSDAAGDGGDSMAMDTSARVQELFKSMCGGMDQAKKAASARKKKADLEYASQVKRVEDETAARMKVALTKALQDLENRSAELAESSANDSAQLESWVIKSKNHIIHPFKRQQEAIKEAESRATISAQQLVEAFKEGKQELAERCEIVLASLREELRSADEAAHKPFVMIFDTISKQLNGVEFAA